MPLRQHKPLVQLPPEGLTKFWTHFVVGTSNECWNWTGRQNTNGYGQFSVNAQDTRTYWIASRVAYYVGYGIDPSTLNVCHHCDNRLCVNWNHMFLGTNADNTKDMVTKGRHKLPPKCPWENYARGEHVGTSILTEESVKEIRKLHATGDYSYVRLGVMFGVTWSCAWSVVKRKNWKHI